MEGLRLYAQLIFNFLNFPIFPETKKTWVTKPPAKLISLRLRIMKVGKRFQKFSQANMDSVNIHLLIEKQRRAEGGRKGRPSSPKVISGGDCLPPKFPDNLLRKCILEIHTYSLNMYDLNYCKKH